MNSIAYCTINKNIPGLIPLLDFEKPLTHSSSHSLKKQYGFGLSIQKWIQTLCCNIESRATRYGLAKYAPIKQGHPVFL